MSSIPGLPSGLVCVWHGSSRLNAYDQYDRRTGDGELYLLKQGGHWMLLAHPSARIHQQRNTHCPHALCLAQREGEPYPPRTKLVQRERMLGARLKHAGEKLVK